MRFKTEDFRAGLKAVAPAIAANAAQPALAAVTLVASEQGLEARGTDHDTWITTRIDATQADIGEWTAAVSHRLLTIVAGLTRAKEIEVAPDGAMLSVAAGKASWALPVIPTEHAATAPIASETFAELDAEAFAGMVSRVAVAAAEKDGYTPPLTVVECAVSDGRITLAASDRYRVHQDSADVSAAGEHTIYPHAARLESIVSALSGRVTIGTGGNGSSFTISDGRTTIQSRAIAVTKWLGVDAKIAAWQRGITARTIVPADDLLDAIKSAQVTLSEGQGVRITAAAGTLEVHGSDDGNGARSNIPLDDFEHTGPGLVIYLSPKVALPALAACGAQPVEIAWTGPGTAALLSVPGEAATFVLMPLRREDARWIEDGAA